jgi:class 3 adenylate cyclase
MPWPREISKHSPRRPESNPVAGHSRNGPAPDRVLLALVFTDIVGSTALNEAVKDERMNERFRAARVELERSRQFAAK